MARRVDVFFRREGGTTTVGERGGDEPVEGAWDRREGGFRVAVGCLLRGRGC